MKLVVLYCVISTVLSYGFIKPDSSKANAVLPEITNAAKTAVRYWFYMEIETSLNAGYFVKILFPSEFQDISLGAGQTCTINEQPHACEQEGSTVVKITISYYIPGSTRLSLSVPNITNPPASLGSSYFQILTLRNSSLQILDRNQAFARIGIYKALESMTGRLDLDQDCQNIVGKECGYSFKFRVKSFTPASSEFLIDVPKEFEVKEGLSCDVLPYDEKVQAVNGEFECTVRQNRVTVIGLNENLEENTGVHVRVHSIRNAQYKIDTGIVSFEIKTKLSDSYIHLDTLSLPNPFITPGLISSISLSAYNSHARFTQDNTLLTLLSFITGYTIPEGGSISINYQVPVLSDPHQNIGCWILTGIPRMQNGTRPSCIANNGSSSVSIINFGNISAGSKIELVNQIQLTSAITSISIESIHPNGEIIDQNDSSQQLPTVLSQTRLTDFSINYSNPQASKQSSISISLRPTEDLNVGSELKVYIPSGFSLINGETPACSMQAEGKASVILKECRLNGNVLSIITEVDKILKDDGAEIKIMSSGEGWNMPSMASSVANPIEWCIEVYQTSENRLLNSECVISQVNPSDFEIGTGKSEVIPMSYSPDLFTPITISLKIDYTISHEFDRTPQIDISFLTHDGANPGFSIDLGTSYSTTQSLPCTPISIITNKSTSELLTCNLTPATAISIDNNAIISISNFKDISSGSIIKLRFFLKSPRTPSISSNLIKVTSYYTSYNNIQSILQEGYLPVITSSIPNSWATKSLISRSNTVISAETTISLSLKLSSYSTAQGDSLVIIFPPGWDISVGYYITIGSISVSKSESYSNEYASCIVAELDSNVMRSGQDSVVEIVKLVNPSVAGLGGGKITAGVVSKNQSITEYVDYGELINELTNTTPGYLEMNVSANILSKAAGDVTYTIELMPEHAVNQGGEVHVIFPSSYDLRFASCISTSNILSISSQILKTCKINSSTIKLTNFQLISAGQSFSLIISTVKNPSTSPTSAFSSKTLFSSDSTAILDQLSPGPILTLSSSYSPGDVKITSISFFPNSAGSYADFFLSFNLECSVPKGGVLSISFPSSYTLPDTWNNDSCMFNMHYLSCRKQSNVISIEPYNYFLAGASMELSMRNMIVPVSKTDPIVINVRWNDVDLCTNPEQLTGEFYFIPKAKSFYSLNVQEISAKPINAAETAVLTFKLTANSVISEINNILVRFPDEYPEFLGYNIKCESELSTADNEGVSCDNPKNRGYLVISGFKTIPASQLFTITIYNTLNPGKSGSSSSFSIHVLNSDNSIQNLMFGSYILMFTSIPKGLNMYGLESSSYSIRSTSTYSFYLTLPSAVLFPDDQIWIIFPEYDYIWELYGYNQHYSCDLEVMNGSNVLSTPTCINSSLNTIVLSSSKGAISSGSSLKLLIYSIKSPNMPGLTHSFSIKIYSTSNNSVISRTYPYTSLSDSLEFLQDRQVITVESSENYFKLPPGSIATYRIHTGSTKTPSRKNLTFSANLLSKYGRDSIEIEPSSIVLNTGVFSVDMSISVGSDSLEGDYILEWSMTGDDSLLYHEPAVCMINVTQDKLLKVSVENIPVLLKGKSSIPIFIYLEGAPYEELILNVYTPEGVTATVPRFTSGMLETSFILTVSDDVSPQNARISYSLSGTNSDSFYLVTYEDYFIITDYDETDPELASFLVNYPKNRLYVDFTIQTTEACTFYYTYGERGLSKPSNFTIIEHAENSLEGYYINYIGGSLLHNFRAEGLAAERDYVLYGYLKDMNERYSNDVFRIEFFTADLYEPAMFVIKLENLPGEEVLDLEVKEVIRKQFAIPEEKRDRIQRLEIDSIQKTVSYLILNDDTSDLPSPLEMIQYMAIPSELSSALSPFGIVLDTSFNIASSGTLVPNSHPEWSLYPTEVTLTPSSVSFEISLNIAGTIYAEIVEDSEYLPSSRQVSLFLDAYDVYAPIHHLEEVSANKVITILLSDLNPASSYILLITAISNNSPTRLMKDDDIVKKSIITRAGVINDDVEIESSVYLCVSMILGILLV